MSKLKQSTEPSTEFISVTTMVEVPILSALEKAEFMATIEQGRRDIAEGRGLTLTADEFEVWFSERVEERRKLKKKHVQS